MSIIRNSRSTSTVKTNDNSLTIKSFPKGEQFITGCGYYPRYWVGLNNKYLKPHLSTDNFGVMSLALGDTLVVKCEIASDASGPLFGSEDSLRIVKDGSNIKWMNGSTVLRTEAYASGIHLYGFFNSANGMYPYYDRDVSGTKITSCSTRALYIGGYSNSSGAATGVCITISGSTNAIKVYEVIGALTYVLNNTSERAVTHYYAATNATTGTTPYMFETRFHSPDFYMQTMDGSVSGVTARSELGNFPNDIPGYGVQLLDLTTVFNSPSKDLLAVASIDGGLDIDAGYTSQGDGEGQADKQLRLLYDDENHDYAFHFNNGSNVAIPVPTGTQVVAGYEGSQGYNLGDLRKGRKPKWSIWNDCIKFGFHVLNATTENRKMMFNVLKIMNLVHTDVAHEYGTIDGKCWLQWFDGYNTFKEADANGHMTVNSKCHPPKVQIIGDAALHLHNGAFSNCDILSLMGGNPGNPYWPSGSVSATALDSDCIFVLNESSAQVFFVAGNLIPWNYAKADLEPNQWLPLGCSVLVRMTAGNEEYMRAEEGEQQGVTLVDSDFPAQRKAQYQSIGFTKDLELMKNRWFLLDYFDENGDQARMKAALSVKADIGSINCESLCAPQLFSVTAVRDAEIQQNSGKFRMIVDYASDGANDQIAVIGEYEGQKYNVIPSYAAYMEGANNRTAVAIKFLAATDTGETYINDYGVTVHKYIPDFTPYSTIGQAVSSPLPNALDYIAVLELYYITTTGGVTYYNLRTCFKESIAGASAFDTAYPAINRQTDIGWGEPPKTYPRSFWNKGMSTIRQMKYGTQTYTAGTTNNTNGTSVNNDITELEKYTRFICATNRDFWAEGNDMIPADSTVIAHIYKKTTAPIFSYSGSWDSEHHVRLESFGSGSSLKRLAFTKNYYKDNYGNGSTQHINLVFLAYDSSYNIAAMGNCNVELYINGTLYDTYQIRNFAYYPNGYVHGGQTESYHLESFAGEQIDSYLDINNAAVADELVFGLSDNYWQGAYFGLDFEIASSDINRGDRVEIKFKNPS